MKQENLFIIPIKTVEFFEVVKDDVEERFDISNYDAEIPLLMGKCKKVLA